MSKKSNNQGRAYEYVFLHTLHDAISEVRTSEILTDNSSYEAASRAWDTLGDTEQALYRLSALSTIETIFALEPNIIEESGDVLELYIQSDQRGVVSDVRDIIIKRGDISWEIGLSIKHNHMAVKHSRLSKGLDFGMSWYGVPCSSMYWEEVKPVFDTLEKLKSNGVRFRDLKDKEETVYLPLLNAFMKEIETQVSRDRSIPGKMVKYLLSKYDFYKVISIDRKRTTTIQSFNMYGTLNQPSRKKTPSCIAPKISLPRRLLHIGLKPDSKNTVLICFDNGWQFSFRIHNASTIVEPSLKFDIQILGMPTVARIEFNCIWQEK